MGPGAGEIVIRWGFQVAGGVPGGSRSVMSRGGGDLAGPAAAAAHAPLGVLTSLDVHHVHRAQRFQRLFM